MPEQACQSRAQQVGYQQAASMVAEVEAIVGIPEVTEEQIATTIGLAIVTTMVVIVGKAVFVEEGTLAE